MSEYSPEFSKMKAQISAKIQEYIEAQIAKKKAGIKVHGNEPKMALRAQRSLVSSTDETFADLVEEALSKDWDGEKIKNKIRSLIEKRFPDAQKLIPTDRIHHRNALEMLGPLAKQKPEVVFGALKILEDEGEFFGDSWQNTKGSSFDERAHSGAMPKDSKSKIIYPRHYGEEGLRDISGHPMGTKDSRMPIEDRMYETPEELADAIREKLQYSRDSYARAEFAAKDQRAKAQEIAEAAGVTEDIYSTDVSPEGLKKAQTALKTAESQQQVASAFKTPDIKEWNQVQATARAAGAAKGLNKAQMLALSTALPGIVMLPFQAKATEQAEEQARLDPTWKNKLQAYLERVSLEADKIDAVAPNPVTGGVSNVASLGSAALDVPDAIQRNQKNLQSKRDGTYQSQVVMPKPEERFGHRVNEFLKDPVQSTNQGLKGAWQAIKGFLPEPPDEEEQQMMDNIMVPR